MTFEEAPALYMKEGPCRQICCQSRKSTDGQDCVDLFAANLLRWHGNNTQATPSIVCETRMTHWWRQVSVYAFAGHANHPEPKPVNA